MGRHFNGWGAFHERLRVAELRNPKIAVLYNRLLDEMLEKEKIGNRLFGTLSANPDWHGWYEYEKREIKPINDQIHIVWNQLFCKHKRVETCGHEYLSGGEREDDYRDVCLDCGAEGMFGVDFGKKLSKKGGESCLKNQLP